ncbi:MAG: hypothetical protein ACW98J_08365 [Candidatus Thorarchaeota archaeon]|jgi:hypothetical protein
MSYCELWLETNNREFRVAMFVPVGFELPEGFTRLASGDLGEKGFYVSDWYSGIAEAKSNIDRAAKFYTELSVKFLYFREIRRPRTM